MHKDFAIESLEYHVAQSIKHEWKNTGEFVFCRDMMMSEKKFLEFVIEKGEEISKNIAKTLIEALKNKNKYFRITEKQSSVIARDITSKFKMMEVIEILFKHSDLI